MSRRDDDRFDYDDDMQRPSRGKSGFPGWLIVLLIALPIGAVVLIGGAVAMFTMRSANAERAEAQANVAVKSANDKKVFTREEFKSMIGATPEDVAAEFGEPHVKIAGNNRTTWHYQNKTVNPATGKSDSAVEVVFVGGIVVEVNF